MARAALGCRAGPIFSTVPRPFSEHHRWWSENGRDYVCYALNSRAKADRVNSEKDGRVTCNLWPLPSRAYFFNGIGQMAASVRVAPVFALPPKADITDVKSDVGEGPIPLKKTGSISL